MSTSEKDPIFKGRVAVILGGSLLIGFAGLAWLTSLDRRERTALEAFEEPTAAGVPATVIPAGSEEGPNSAAVLRLKGLPYYAEDTVRHSDGTMMKAGTDDSGAIPIYRRMRHDKLKPELYIKLGPGRFLEIGLRDEPKKEEKPAEPAPEATAS